MTGNVMLVVLAAWGVLCLLWCGFGWLLSGGRGGCAVCMCRGGMQEELFIRRWRWLRSLGLVEGRLLAVDCGLEEPQRRWLARYRDVEICSLEELPDRLELERNQIE